VVAESRVVQDFAMMLSLRLLCFAAAATAMALLTASAAHAQGAGIPGAPTRSYSPPTKQRPEDMPQPAPPPALPGAKSNYEPAERTATDLQPNDALFDAINRGDMAAARDALNRGADLSAHNILGMTPLELSVDLAHNDITFLLLSLRGTQPAGGSAPAKAATAAAAPPPKTPGKPAPKFTAASQRPPVAPAPQQFAGPGSTGIPNPQAGFLGFGGTVQ
jgi:hypothetical protein